MSEKTEDWIIDAAEAIARHVSRARSPAFQMTAEFKIEEAHRSGCAAATVEQLKGIEFAAYGRHSPGGKCPACMGAKSGDYGYSEAGPDEGHEDGCWLKAAIRRGGA